MNLNINMNSVLLHLSRLNVYHHYLGSSCPCSPGITNLSYRKSAAYNNDKIGILYRKVTRSVTHIAATSAVKRIVCLDQIDRIPICANRYPELINNFSERFKAAGNSHSATCIDNGTLSFFDHLYNIIDSFLINFRNSFLVRSRLFFCVAP